MIIIVYHVINKTCVDPVTERSRSWSHLELRKTGGRKEGRSHEMFTDNNPHLQLQPVGLPA